MSRSSNVASVCLGVVRLLAYPLPVCLGLLLTWPSVFESKGGGSRTCRNLGGFCCLVDVGLVLSVCL
jgi:hypothetical protein